MNYEVRYVPPKFKKADVREYLGISLPTPIGKSISWPQLRALDVRDCSARVLVNIGYCALACLQLNSSIRVGGSIYPNRISKRADLKISADLCLKEAITSILPA